MELAFFLRNAAERVQPEDFENDAAFKLLHDVDMRLEELLDFMEAAAVYLKKAGSSETKNG